MLKLNLKENWQLLEVQPSQNGSNLPSHKKQFFLYSEYCYCLGSCGTTCAIRQMTLFSYVIPLMIMMAHWPLLFPHPSGQMFLLSSAWNFMTFMIYVRSRKHFQKSEVSSGTSATMIQSPCLCMHSFVDDDDGFAGYFSLHTHQVKCSSSCLLLELFYDFPDLYKDLMKHLQKFQISSGTFATVIQSSWETKLWLSCKSSKMLEFCFFFIPTHLKHSTALFSSTIACCALLCVSTSLLSSCVHRHMFSPSGFCTCEVPTHITNFEHLSFWTCSCLLR